MLRSLDYKLYLPSSGFSQSAAIFATKGRSALRGPLLSRTQSRERKMSPLTCLILA